MMPRITLARVDLPQPDSPTSPTVSRRCTTRSTASTALTPSAAARRNRRARRLVKNRPTSSRRSSSESSSAAPALDVAVAVTGPVTDGGTTAQPGNDAEVVRDEDDCRAEFPVQGGEQV